MAMVKSLMDISVAQKNLPRIETYIEVPPASGMAELILYFKVDVLFIPVTATN